MKTKNILTVVFVVLVLALLVFIIFFLPASGGEDESLQNGSSAGSEGTETTQNPSAVSVEESGVTEYTAASFIENCDTVISGTVIKATQSKEGTEYTFSVSKVYKGRNYSSMGYAYVKGEMTLKLAETYLFLGNVGEEKYHYFEPFDGAPWVFTLDENKLLLNISNGDPNYCPQLEGMDLERLKELCEN